jgi:hypothetical protein
MGTTPLKGFGRETPLKGFGGETPLKEVGGETPLRGFGGETPLRGFGGETPLKEVGGETPLRGFGRGDELTKPTAERHTNFTPRRGAVGSSPPITPMTPGSASHGRKKTAHSLNVPRLQIHGGNLMSPGRG